MSHKPHIAFYIHHHGSGHLMRCLAIAAELNDTKITFLGSGLEEKRKLIPAPISIVELDIDTPQPNDFYFRDSELYGLHYAPLNIAGQCRRNEKLVAFFNSHSPVILIVDVSAEVAMLAKLCGVPTIVVRQHGKRDDLPHELCFRNAWSLLAPYPKWLLAPEETWITEKTFFSGGLSRFRSEVDLSVAKECRVAILVGDGGTSIDKAFINHLSTSCPEWHFELIGSAFENYSFGDHVTSHGSMKDPRVVLRYCSIVIGNSGNNTVMELAAMNKRYIAIPEPRPFDEQRQKAKLLSKLGLALIVEPDQLMDTEWENLLISSLTHPSKLGALVNPYAAPDAANFILKCYFDLYGVRHLTR